MAASLIGGLVADGYNPKHIIVSDPDSEKLASLAARFSVRTAADNLTAIADADVVMLAVKPQVLETVAGGLAASLHERKPLIISIAAGVRESTLRSWLGEGLPLVRTMPNTPAMIQAGATVLHASPAVTDEQRNLAESILRAVGTPGRGSKSRRQARRALQELAPIGYPVVPESEWGGSICLPGHTTRGVLL